MKLTTAFAEVCRANNGLEDYDGSAWAFDDVDDAANVLAALGIRFSFPSEANGRQIMLKVLRRRRIAYSVPYNRELTISFGRRKSDRQVRIVEVSPTIMASLPIEPLPVRSVRRDGVSEWQRLVKGVWVDTNLTGARKALRLAGYRGDEIARAVGYCILHGTSEV